MKYALLAPMFAMMGLTASVWGVMYYKRLNYIKQYKIDAQALASRKKLAELLPDHIQAPANNLNNLLELPVLFYAIGIISMIQPQQPSYLVELAWLYVLLRTIHSLIQCTNNRVIYRFSVYFLSSLVLFAIIIRCAIAWLV